jgi:hypothetical protein
MGSKWDPYSQNQQTRTYPAQNPSWCSFKMLSEVPFFLAFLGQRRAMTLWSSTHLLYSALLRIATARVGVTTACNGDWWALRLCLLRCVAVPKKYPNWTRIFSSQVFASQKNKPSRTRNRESGNFTEIVNQRLTIILTCINYTCIDSID